MPACGFPRLRSHASLLGSLFHIENLVVSRYIHIKPNAFLRVKGRKITVVRNENYDRRKKVFSGF